MGKFWVLQNKGLSNVIIVIFSYVQMWAPGLHLMCCVCQQQLGLHHSILSKHWLNHNAITQWSLDHKAITQLLNHKSVIDSIPHRPVINVRGSPQIASQWILDPCLLHPGLLAGISQAKSIPQSSSWWYWCRCCLNSTLLRICCVLTDLNKFRLPQAILVNLEEGGTFAWVLPRLNVIFWWYLRNYDNWVQICQWNNKQGKWQ